MIADDNEGEFNIDDLDGGYYEDEVGDLLERAWEEGEQDKDEDPENDVCLQDDTDEDNGSDFAGVEHVSKKVLKVRVNDWSVTMEDMHRELSRMNLQIARLHRKIADLHAENADLRRILAERETVGAELSDELPF